MNDLAAFLNARLDEDEARARAFTVPEWMIRENGEFDYTVMPVQATATTFEAIADVWREDVAGWITLHDPAHILREVAAKRAILAMYAALQSAADYERRTEGAAGPGVLAAIKVLEFSLGLLADTYRPLYLLTLFR